MVKLTSKEYFDVIGKNFDKSTNVTSNNDVK